MHDNSVEAYLEELDNFSERYEQILGVYMTMRIPLTDRRICKALGYGQDMNKVRPRITELVHKFGLLVETGTTIDHRTNKRCRLVTLRKAPAKQGLKVIIAGSRTLEHPLLVRRAVRESKFKITEVVSGCAPEGADKFGERWAKQNNILVKQFPADWLTHGKAAGMLRNVQMADYADALIAIWDGESVGTRNMIGEMGKRQKPVFVLRFEV